MTSESVSRESQRVRDLAVEYRKKGYAVVEPHGPEQLPRFLRSTGYVPDLVATSEHGSLVIEVKSQRSAQDLGRLSEVSELVNAQQDWQFVLVLTNPRKSAASDATTTVAKVRELLAKAAAIGRADATHAEASFLFAWAALEASLRLLPEELKGAKSPSSAGTLVRNAAMAGHIARRDAQSLERLFRTRNSLLHSGTEPSPKAQDIDLLNRITEEVVRSADRDDEV